MITDLLIYCWLLLADSMLVYHDALCPTQHDHLLLFGDMNYRMDKEASGGGWGSITGVAEACSIEKSAFQGDPRWLRRKYSMLRYFKDPLFPTIDEIQVIRQAHVAAQSAWSNVLRADELRSIMEAGELAVHAHCVDEDDG